MAMTSATNKATAGETDAGATNSAGFDQSTQSVMNTILQQLMGGGTPQMQRQTSARDTEVANLQAQRGGYSKEAAFADAQGLMAQTMRQALEKLLPGINSGALGAGASQSSMRALLTQRAAENTAQAASAEGIKAATSYGQVAGGLSDVIARLLSVQDPSAELLIRALGTAKGGTSSSGGGRSSGGSGTSAATQFAGPSLFGGGSQTPSAPMAPMVFGGGGRDYSGQNRSFSPIPDPNPENIVGTTADTLRELAGDTSFRGYTF